MVSEMDFQGYHFEDAFSVLWVQWLLRLHL